MKRVLLLATLALCASAGARPLFVPSPLSSFNGKSWSGLVLGQTTFKSVRPQFETGKGAYERSTELTMPKNTGLRVDCLWAKRGDNEFLSAITLRYSGATPSGEQLARAFDADQTHTDVLYPRSRFEDWRIVRFPLRGVSAFQVRGNGGAYATPLLVLSAPSSLARLSGAMLEDETPVEERVDPMANAPKVGGFGEATVEFSGRETDEVPDWVRTNLRRDLRDTSAGGTLEWNRGSSGFYKLSVSGSRAKDGGRGSVSVSSEIEASGPYGTIHVSGSGSQSWKIGNDDGPTSLSEAFPRAIREARHDAETKFQNVMLASGPPTLADIRHAQWDELVGVLRADETEVAAPEVDAPVVGF